MTLTFDLVIPKTNIFIIIGVCPILSTTRLQSMKSLGTKLFEISKHKRNCLDGQMLQYANNWGV